MKKLIMLVLALVCILSLVGCNNRSMNYIIENEPSMMGIVKDTKDNSILIENEDGNIAESYPMQINIVYAITLKIPADRTENEKS